MGKVTDGGVSVSKPEGAMPAMERYIMELRAFEVQKDIFQK